MKTEKGPAEPPARWRFGLFEVAGSSRFVSTALGGFVIIVLVLLFLPSSPLRDWISAHTTAPLSPDPRDGVTAPPTDSRTDGPGRSTADGGANNTPAPALPTRAAKRSFDPVPDSRHVKGKSLAVRGTVEGFSSKSTLQCIVTGATGHYFFYDTYGDTHADKGAWNAEVLLGPDPPKITLPKKFTLILVAAPQSAMDEIGEGKADTGAYNVDGLSRIPPDAETLAEIAITRDS
ncbi:MAG: hypothetical protein ACRDRI_20855 [Pseudonocardiaceae bacterium]